MPTGKHGLSTGGGNKGLGAAHVPPSAWNDLLSLFSHLSKCSIILSLSLSLSLSRVQPFLTPVMQLPDLTYHPSSLTSIIDISLLVSLLASILLPMLCSFQV